MFTHPLFLLGLVALAIPMVVHLFNFRRYKRVYFSNVDRLFELQTETRKQSQLRQYLVLAARLLAILFLVLAFAQPVIPHKDQQLLAGTVAVSIYLDNSFSMQNTDAEAQLIETGRQKVREIVAAYKPSDRFQLLTNDATGAQFRWLSRDNLLAALDEVEISSVSRSLSHILQRQSDFLRQSGAANLHAYLVSDFQTSTADIDQLVCDSLVRATLVPLRSAQSDNLFFDSLSLNAPATYLGAHVTVEVRLRNSGSTPVEKVPVRLYLNGQQRALASVDLPAEASAMVPLHFVVDQTGPLNGYVELSDYPVTFDDRCFFSLNVEPSISMLALCGKAENPFLRKLFSADSLVGYRALSERSLNYADLPRHQFLVLDEPAAVSSGLAQALKDFVDEGGSVLVIPSDKADRDSYNAFLASLRAPLLQPWSDKPAKVSDIHYDSPLFSGVFTSRVERPELPTLKGHYPLQRSAATLAVPALTLADGGDYLTVTPCGRGSLYLFSAPLRSECSDFPHQALFVPTLYNMALFSRPLSAPYALLGDLSPIPLTGISDDPSATPHLCAVDSSVDLVPTLRRSGSQVALIPSDVISLAGNYLLGGQALSFNYNPAESLMRFYSPRELAKLLEDYHLDNLSVMLHAERSLDQQIRQQMEGTPLWRWCLLLALFFLLAEILLLRLPPASPKAPSH